MRSSLIVRRTRSFPRPPFIPHRALLSSNRPNRYPRKASSVAPVEPPLVQHLSSLTSTSGPPEEPDSEIPRIVNGSPDSPPEEEKPKRRVKVQLAPDFEILWTPDAEPEATAPLITNGSLPPPEIFQEVLTNLNITLHPQTQRRAAYASQAGPPQEPTLALYCPIEGGDYVIDETVKELSRQTGADVVVLDAVQLAGGECGGFGKAASAIQFPQNPLHFTSPSSPATPPSTQAEEPDDADDLPGQFMSSPAVTLHVMGSRSPRIRSIRKTSTNSGMVKTKAFFDELINVVPASQDNEETASDSRRPRIIYIRDFPTLASSSHTWYPALLASVRQRRQGPLAKSNAPVHSPTTIVFGITPPLVPSPPPSSSSTSPGLPGFLSMLMNRNSNGPVIVSSPSRSKPSDFAEDEKSEKAREQRLRDRLRKWERGNKYLEDDLPTLSTSTEEDWGNGRSSGSPEVIVMEPGDSEIPMLSSGSGLTLASRLGGRSGGGNSPESDRSNNFFRTSIIVPSIRSMLLEKACRVDRRREINELTMRMGIAAVGGSLGKMAITPEDAAKLDGEDPSPASLKMWDDWGNTVEVWSNVLQIADRVVGRAIAVERSKSNPSSLTLDSTPVGWPEVYQAWELHKNMKDTKKSWIQHSLGRPPPEDEEQKKESPDQQMDEVVERVKRDAERGELDQHEQRLLGCIVDANSLTTTFNQVHLPPHTIDAVRTIVSLPLLHPSAFQLGILKEHSMTGCLLFGPPGTGKTLVVRALAKEAGCRMLAISPSDVMDMYVGEAEKLVKSVFSLARRLSPCVVFLDEIDALFGARSSHSVGGGDHVHRGVITEFMQEMDGLKSRKDDNIMVIGATNRPFDLDDAVLRRLPRRLLVDLPGGKEREEILRILLRDEVLAPDVDLNLLARKTESFSGSDLKHLCVSAALDAVKERVSVPWRPSPPSGTPTETLVSTPPPEATPSPLETASESVQPQEQEQPLQTEATLDATQESTTPPTSETPAPEAANSEEKASAATLEHMSRTLSWRNFTVALKEITPSSSERLGTLAELRKWNEEFGEGRKERKKQVWGKDRFGFTVQTLGGGDVRVQAKTAAPSTSTRSE
ncbi:hypothetical protein C8Q75DRAFT_24213 [Abortiporus biennis]|nr:hypothetical protein C8Q75DRAFT_24213 [Abortiporus biennis]